MRDITTYGDTVYIDNNSESWHTNDQMFISEYEIIQYHMKYAKRYILLYITKPEIKWYWYKMIQYQINGL